MIHSPISIANRQLWDFAGVDGLQAAKLLFGESINRLAPFQSLETELVQTPCSVLRLCEGNFRVSAADSAQPALADALRSVFSCPTQPQLWLKQFDWLESIVLPDSIQLADLRAIAIPKPPHRLELALHCAAPTRIAGISVLIWRHPTSARSTGLELHFSRQAMQNIVDRCSVLIHSP